MSYWDRMAGDGPQDPDQPGAPIPPPSGAPMAPPPQYRPGTYGPPPVPAPKKKRRVFLWFFLALQALFIIWLISAGASTSGNATDCGTLSQDTCNSARDVGAGIGAILIVGLWIAVDFILGITYLIYRIARRP